MRTDDVPDILTSNAAPAHDTSADRVCLACGYSLRGLGDEPRCPECGLLNIPTGYREQVWELVDSGKWFFSSFFGVLAKRPAGWWWALDRPDDLRRARRFATWHLVVSLLIILAATGLGDAFRVEVGVTYKFPNMVDSAGRPLEPTAAVATYGIGDRLLRVYRNYDVWQFIREGTGGSPVSAVTRRTPFEPGWSFIPIAGIIYLTLVLIWAVPATVGLWTQIRKGLPDFARAPRTIIAASLCEAHRVSYAAVCAAAFMGIDALRRIYLPSSGPTFVGAFLISAIAVLLTGTTAGWIGPIRSDYTRQLVRSRSHAIRIVAMYALVFPLAMAGSIFTSWYFLWSD